MSIRKYYKLVFIVSIILLTKICLIIFFSFRIEYKLSLSELNRFEAYNHALELFQSSEDLTRMARSYVVTGDINYKKNYFRILAIRNGKIIRPDNYDIAYWHIKDFEEIQKPKGQKIALRTLIEEHDISKRELELLYESQANSDKLVNIEKKAFSAVEGLFEDSEGNYTIRKAPDKNLAINLLFSKKYNIEKKRIMAPIREFILLQDARLENMTKSYNMKFKALIMSALLLLLVVLFLMMLSLRYSYLKILRPVESLHDQIKEIEKGNYSARCSIENAFTEINKLNNYFNNMIESIEKDLNERKEMIDLLKNNEEKNKRLLNSTAEAIYGIDILGNCTFANPACAKMLNCNDPSYLLGKNMCSLIHTSPDDRDNFSSSDCRLYDLYSGGKNIHVEEEYIWRIDGTYFLGEYWAYPQISEGKIYGAVVTFIDITERKLSKELLLKEKERFYNILMGANLGSWEWNIQTGETIYNERSAEIIGYKLNELSGANTWRENIHPEDIDYADSLLEKYYVGVMPFYECEMRIKHKDGHWVWVLARGKITKRDKDGRPLLMSGTHLDITERKKEEEKIKHMANHDVLTDLPSKRLAEDRLSMAINIAKRNKNTGALLFIDLDGFKAINDVFGHDAGDEVLKEVGKKLTSSVRTIDTVARIGGDEFLIILSQIKNKENVSSKTKKILKSLAEPIRYNDEDLTIGASIGIAVFPDNSDKIDRLIKLADEAMYKIKKSGKNSFAFAEPQN